MVLTSGLSLLLISKQGVAVVKRFMEFKRYSLQKDVVIEAKKEVDGEDTKVEVESEKEVMEDDVVVQA